MDIKNCKKYKVKNCNSYFSDLPYQRTTFSQFPFTSPLYQNYCPCKPKKNKFYAFSNDGKTLYDISEYLIAGIQCT